MKILKINLYFFINYNITKIFDNIVDFINIINIFFSLINYNLIN